MSVLEVVGRPSNFDSRGYVRITSDVFNICGRIEELDPNLRVRYNETNPEKPWVVTEMAKDGERFVAQYEELDARIIEDLRYMLHVPFLERLAVQDKREAERKAAEERGADDLYQEMAGHFEHDLRKAGLRGGSGPNFRPKRRG